MHLEGALPERFCDNLAIALAQDIERKQVKPPLEWPMVGKGIDQSLEAARQVVAHHIAQLPPLTLVFGEAMPHYYPPLEAAKPNGETTTEGRRLLLLPGVEAVMQSATLKRELWQRLQG